jgi:hypothetical protein
MNEEKLVPTLQRGNAIPRRSSVGEQLTNFNFYVYAWDAGAWERVKKAISRLRLSKPLSVIIA